MQRCRGPGAGRTGTEMLTEMLDLSVVVKKITDTICTCTGQHAPGTVEVPLKCGTFECWAPLKWFENLL